MSEDKKAKRDHGSGNISKRKDGTWTARIQVGKTQNGNPKIKALYAKTEAEAKKKLKEYIKEMHQNDFKEVQKDTVADYMTRWLTTVKINELKPKSYDRLEATVNNQIIPEIGYFQTANLSSDNVQSFINLLFNNGLSYSTVKKAYDAINNCFRTGMIKGSIKHNPALGVVLKTSQKSTTNTQIKFYTESETKALILAATETDKAGKLKYRLGYCIPLLLNTGLRIGELLALRWDNNIDLNNNTILVTNTMVSVKNRDESDDRKYILLDQDSTKSISGNRILHLNKVAYNALLELKKQTGEMIYVMSSKNNQPINPRNIDRLMRNVCRICNFSDDRVFGVHSLRHTFASRLFEKGVDVKTISEILGHSDTKITYDTYIHLIEKQKKDAIFILDEI